MNAEEVRRVQPDLARLQAGQRPSDQIIVVGAHVDHLGTGQSSTSLARGDQQGVIHFGADDNASGVAAVLEIAQYLAEQSEQPAGAPFVAYYNMDMQNLDVEIGFPVTACLPVEVRSKAAPCR